MNERNDGPTDEGLLHGSRVQYVSGRCRCDRCRAANCEYVTAWRRETRADKGARARTGATARAVVARLRALQAHGMGTRQIAGVSGVSRTQIHNLLSGRSQTCGHKVAEAVLSVPVGKMAGGAKVCAVAAWNDIATLEAHGWSRAQIAGALGYQSPKLQLGKTRITAAVDARIARLVRAAGCEPAARRYADMGLREAPDAAGLDALMA